MIARAIRLVSLPMLAKAAMVAICLLAAPTAARASALSDCLVGIGKIATGYDQAMAAKDFFSNPDNIPCLSLTGDPYFKALVAALIVAKEAGAFDTADQCKGAISTLLSQVVIAGAKQLNIDVPTDDAATLAKWISDNTLGQTFMQQWDCGCAVAVYGIQGLENTFHTYKTTIEACGEVIGDAISWLEDWWDTNFGDDGYTTPTPPHTDPACRWGIAYCLPVQQDQCSGFNPTPIYGICPSGHICECVWGLSPGGDAQICHYYDPSQLSCSSGTQCGPNLPMIDWANAISWGKKLSPSDPDSWSACVPCSKVDHGTPIGEGLCGCEGDFQPVYTIGPSGKQTLRLCICGPPMISGPGTCSKCPLGQKPDPTHTKCVPACNSGEILNGACKKCSENQRAVYLAAGFSLGVCEECPYGTSSPAGSTQCAPLDCGANGYQDPDNPHACKSCPSGQIYIEAKIVPTPGATETEKEVVKTPGHCGCPEGTKPDGDTCACATGAIKQMWANTFTCACPEGGYVDQASFACKCPAGANLDPTGTKCVCPPGMKCGPPVQLKTDLAKEKVPPKDCSALGPAFINNPKDAGKCMRCTGRRVANAARTACIAKTGAVGTGVPISPKIKRRGDTWLNPQPEPPMRRISCPPRMTPNAKGTACVPQLDMPGFKAAPGSLPGVRRGAPSSPTRR